MGAYSDDFLVLVLNLKDSTLSHSKAVRSDSQEQER